MGIGVQYGGLAAPIVSPHSQGFFSLPSLPASFFLPCSRLAPWRPRISPLSTVTEVTFLPLLPPALASPPSPLASISCVPHGNAVSGAWPHSSSSVSASDVASLPPLYPSLSASPPSPPLPTSPGPLRPLAPHHALQPPALAADIARRDENVGDQTGGVVAHWSLLGGSAHHGKCPRSPCALVGDGISRPLFLHLPQQWHPVHFLPAFLHSHTLADGPVVEQVEC